VILSKRHPQRSAATDRPAGLILVRNPQPRARAARTNFTNRLTQRLRGVPLSSIATRLRRPRPNGRDPAVDQEVCPDDVRRIVRREVNRQLRDFQRIATRNPSREFVMASWEFHYSDCTFRSDRMEFSGTATRGRVNGYCFVVCAAINASHMRMKRAPRPSRPTLCMATRTPSNSRCNSSASRSGSLSPVARHT
jgi:hypothetical protein